MKESSSFFPHETWNWYVESRTRKKKRRRMNERDDDKRQNFRTFGHCLSHSKQMMNHSSSITVRVVNHQLPRVCGREILLSSTLFFSWNQDHESLFDSSLLFPSAFHHNFQMIHNQDFFNSIIRSLVLTVSET